MSEDCPIIHLLQANLNAYLEINDRLKAAETAHNEKALTANDSFKNWTKSALNIPEGIKSFEKRLLSRIETFEQKINKRLTSMEKANAQLIESIELKIMQKLESIERKVVDRKFIAENKCNTHKTNTEDVEMELMNHQQQATQGQKNSPSRRILVLPQE